MSLFGGEGSVSPSPTAQFEDSLLQRSPSPQNAQEQPQILFAPDPDDSVDEDFQPSSSDSETIPRKRSKLKPSTWRRYTAADRKIAASLENIESTDLAAHLYNAHNLKRRVRQTDSQLRTVKDWQSKDSWLRKGEELRYEDPVTGEPQTQLVPSKLWTAWPLPPNRLSMTNAKVPAAEGDEDAWYIDSSKLGHSGDSMREEALALFLRTAKENWIARRTDNENTETSADVRRMPSPTAISISSSATDVEDQPGTRKVDGSETDMDDRWSASTASHSGRNTGSDGAFLTEKSPRDSSVPKQPATVCTFIVDDDASRRILEPSVNSLLSSLDKLALALRRNRLNHFGSRTYNSGSGSDYATDTEVQDPRSRASSRAQSQSRKPKKMLKPTRGKDPSKAKQRGLTSPDKDFASEYGADYESSDEEQLSPPNGSRKMRASSIASNSSRGSNTSNNKSHTRNAGLMDWSELLGIAAVIGLDKRMVVRTAQRCASLFDEGMDFRTFDEDLAAQSIPKQIQYIPSTIPAPESSDLDGRLSKRPYFKPGSLRCPHPGCGKQWKYPSETIKHVQHVHFYDPRTNNSRNASMKPTLKDISRPQKTDINAAKSMTKRPYFDPGSLRCPHLDCPGSSKDFSGSNRLTEHVRRKHGYDPRTNDSDNEERTVGGVHTDGFLQPIWAKPGWLGHSRAKSEGIVLEPEIPRRKKQKLDSKPTSAMTSAYETQGEQGERGHIEQEEAVQTRGVTSGAARRLHRNKACSNCARRKKPCDGHRPCGRCRQLGEELSCADRVYALKTKSCLNCKSRKQKCDRNYPCARCEQRDEECEY